MRIRTLPILLLSLAAAAAVAHPCLAAPGAASGALAVDCAGAFLSIAPSGPGAEIVARGHLWDGSGGEVLRPASARGFDGCLVADAAGDPAGRYLYVVVAQEPYFGADHTRGYRIAALSLPDLEVLSSFVLERVPDGPIAVMVSPAGDELLVSYPDRGARGSRVLRLPAPDLGSAARLATKEGGAEDGGPTADRVISARARWIEGGRVVDGPAVLGERGELIASVDPYATFAGDVAEELAGLRRKGAAGAPYLPIAFADGAADRMLFVVAPDWLPDPEARGGGFVVYDLTSRRSVSAALAEQAAAFDPTGLGTPTVRLTPDGGRVVVESHRKSDGDRFKTGTLRVFDAATGTLEATISLGEAPGTGAGILGFSGDGSTLYYGSRRGVTVVDLEAGVELAELDPGDGFDPLWVVGLATWED